MAKSDQEKINALRALTSTVINNTKREINGQSGNASKEAKQIKEVLGLLLGRAATEAEVSDAQRV